MKKKSLIILVLSLIFVMGACANKDSKGNNETKSENKQQVYTEKDYEESVKEFKKTDIKELNNKIDKKDNFVVYLGRKTCPYCVMLIPDLKDIMNEIGQETYYLDVENTSNEMDDFFKKYKLEYVPSLLVFKEGNGLEVLLDHNYAKAHGRYDKQEVKKSIEEALTK